MESTAGALSENLYIDVTRQENRMVIRGLMEVLWQVFDALVKHAGIPASSMSFSLKFSRYMIFTSLQSSYRPLSKILSINLRQGCNALRSH